MGAATLLVSRSSLDHAFSPRSLNVYLIDSTERGPGISILSSIHI